MSPCVIFIYGNARLQTRITRIRKKKKKILFILLILLHERLAHGPVKSRKSKSLTFALRLQPSTDKKWRSRLKAENEVPSQIYISIVRSSELLVVQHTE
ncbi:hypothetical protein ACN38_g1782 [Penicillium nordicum]|uniref:Uncharacterized protein n=1 Tax=Penicillium nordicum TaxID=229535 RepID=A0A0M9WJJ0_9EURO|nr:hypothetical protein ACN38_g1782 [Penicillium nordicum]